MEKIEINLTPEQVKQAKRILLECNTFSGKVEHVPIPLVDEDEFHSDPPSRLFHPVESTVVALISLFVGVVIGLLLRG